MSLGFKYRDFLPKLPEFSRLLAEIRREFQHTKLRLQKREGDVRNQYHLHFGPWSNPTRVVLEEHELEQLAEALIEIKLT